MDVVTRRSDGEELRRLVMDELDRHPTHRAAASAMPEKPGGCASHLRVELIEVVEGRYLTGRVADQVPHRERIEGEDLEGALVRLLTVVLHNDPVHLRGPRSESWLQSGLRSLKRGHTLWGAEAFQIGGWLDGRAATLPGLALTVRREVAHWHLGARFAYAGRLDEGSEGLTLDHHVALQLQLTWFTAAAADTSLHLDGLLGVEHQRFSGPAPGFGPGEHDQATATGLSLAGRLGVELFRTTSGRLDVFVQVALPAFVASDEVGAVVDTWFPTVGLGAGMLF